MLNSLVFTSDYRIFEASMINKIGRKNIMDKTKLTREEALRRWKASKEIKRKMMEKLENLEMNAHGKGL